MEKPVNISEILQAIRSVCQDEERFVSLHEPCFGGNELKYLKECIDTGWVSSAGSFVDRFEKELAAFTGARCAIAVVNGTAALHLALLLAGVAAEDEVLIPALTFVATANAVCYCGAVPHFVDSEERTLGVDPEKLRIHLEDIAKERPGGSYNRRTGRRIRALVPMHTFGHPVDLDPLVETCRRFRIEVVEDAAESLGSFYKEGHTGTFGRLAALSFNGNKVITTGGGGAILTNDEELGRLAKHLTTTAKVPHKWDFHHDMTGFNYRLPNINAALGCAQLEQLPAFLLQKRALAQRYSEAFEGIKGVTLFKEPASCRSNYWLNTLLLDEDAAGCRDEILELTNSTGLMTRPSWVLMHHLKMFVGSPRMNLSQAESLATRILNIPSSPILGASYVAS